MKKVNKKIIIIAAIIITVLITTILIITLSSQNPKKSNFKNPTEFLEQTIGVWGRCFTNSTNKKVCYVVKIEKQNDQYTFSIGEHGTDRVLFGMIEKIEHVIEDEYKIDVHTKGCKGKDCIEETEDNIYYYHLTLKEKKLLIDIDTYDYITEDFKNEQKITDYIKQKSNG